MIHEVKSKEDRLKETIHLLKQILKLGIADTDPAYIEIKTHLNEWIKSDDKHVKEFNIEFVRHGRKATLTLPWKSDKTCEFLMKKPQS